MDVGKGVEVAAPAGTDLAGLSLLFYDGTSGNLYATLPLTGIIDHEQQGFGARWFSMPFIQNGAAIPYLIGEADAIALVPPCTNAVQFISYERVVLAGDGQLAGSSSTDIGIWEPTNTETNMSLQVIGSSIEASAFSWDGPSVASPENLNAGQVIPQDADGDGMPSAWEFENFWNFTNGLPGEDTDLDGFSNLEEYIADTIPTNPESFFHISSIPCTGAPTIVFYTSTGRVYGVDVSTNLPGRRMGKRGVKPYRKRGGAMSVPDSNTVGHSKYRANVCLP